MSVELWRSVVPIYAFMFLNVMAVTAAFLWAGRRRLFTNEDELRHLPLREDLAPEEDHNG